MMELMNISWDMVIALTILGLICIGADIIVDISRK
jgi:hypothetical protein